MQTKGREKPAKTGDKWLFAKGKIFLTVYKAAC